MTIETKLIALAQAMGADVKALKAADGDLTALSTTAKGNLVAALNEVFDLVGAIEGDDPTKLPLAGGTLSGALNEAPPVDYNAAGALTAGNLNWDLIPGNTAFPGMTFGISAMSGASNGAIRRLRMAAGITFTHANGVLELPGSANIATEAGDVATFMRHSATRWQCISYQRGDGTALAVAGSGFLALSGGRMTGAINHAGYGTITAANAMNIEGVNANTVRVDNPGGAVTINSIGGGTSGTRRVLWFNAANVTLVHNSGLTILPGNANITPALGDHAEFACEGGATWRCMWYTRRDGTALVSAASLEIDDAAGTGDTDVVWSADKSVTFVTAAVATLEASLMGGAGEAYDTFKELQDLIIADQSGLAALAADIQNRVRFDAAQTLTAPQKTQARDNIGAVSQADVDATIVATVGDVAHDFVADYEAAKA